MVFQMYRQLFSKVIDCQSNVLFVFALLFFGFFLKAKASFLLFVSCGQGHGSQACINVWQQY